MIRFAGILFFLTGLFQGIFAQQIRINEVMTANYSAVFDQDYYNYSEWIELYNAGTAATFVAGYYLSHDPANLKMWQIPSGNYIPAKGFLVIWMDKLNTGLHANFRTRSNDEMLFLSNLSGILVDSVHVKKVYRNCSYGRNPDGGQKWSIFMNGTPGAANVSTPVTVQSPAPVFSVPGGRYSSNQSLAIQNPGTTGHIYFTTNGSEPTVNSTKYTAPLTISSTGIIKARIIEDLRAPGPVVTNTYFIREHATSLPVISVTTDPLNLWDPLRGIYVEGSNGIEGYCYGKTNWNREWERPAAFEYFASDGIRKIGIDAGIKINGACSRTFAQKSLGVYFRDKYGADNIRYPLFDSKEADHFRSIMLRNSGNDFNRTQFQDAMMQSLIMGQLDLDYLAYTPAVLYLNGAYWGVQNIREKSTEDYFYTNYHIDEDSVDLLEFYNSVIAGDNLDYNSLLSFLYGNSLAPSNNYKYVTDRIDIESYMDYQIAEIYFANLDWPGNNAKFWKSRQPGSKWRWLLYDTDFGFGFISSVDHNTLAFAAADQGPDWPNPPWSTFLFRKMLENQEFRNRFVDKFNVYIASTFRPERVSAIIDSLHDRIAGEMPYHFARWGGSVSSWEYNNSVSRDFGNRRPAFMMKYISDFFGLTSAFSLTVKADHPAKDLFSVNDVVIHDTIFSGPYFGDRSVKIRALPVNSLTFNHWEVSTYTTLHEQLIPISSQWNYMDNGITSPAGWKTVQFDDSSWKSGNAEFGYGDSDETTVIDYGPDMNNKYITTYFRKGFYLNDTTNLDSLIIRLKVDDGAVIYLNGMEILRQNMPEGTVSFSTLASGNPADENAYLTFGITTDALVQGDNILAAEIHQVSGSSSDVSFDMGLDLTHTIDLQTDTYYDPEVILNFSKAATCIAYFDPAPVVSSLYINEFCAKNTTISDDMGEYEDWIELYNAGDDTVNVSGLYLTTAFSQPLGYLIPAPREHETDIMPHGYLLLWADGQPDQGTLHLGLKLEKQGGEIGLIQVTGNKFIMLDSVIYGQQYTNLSYGRYADGTRRWFLLSGMTPGEPNTFTYLPTLPSDEEIVLYPNPAVDILHVESENAQGMDIRIIVYNQLGQQLSDNVLKGNGEIDVSGLLPGIYVLHITSGNENYVTKLIKQ